MEKAIVDGDDMTKEELENGNIHATERNDNMGVNETSQEDSANASTATSRGNSVSYVAHEPKIVRARPSNEVHAVASKENSQKPNRSFLRQFSGGGGSGTAGPIQPTSLRCATCMCNVSSDHYRGTSSSLLLVGTTDGALLLVDFAMARVRSVALESSTSNCVAIVEQGDHGECDSIDHRSFNGGHNQTSQQTTTNGHGSQCVGSFYNPIVHLSQCTPTQWKPLDIYGEEQGSESKGRIALVLRDGSVNMYTTSFVVSSAPSGPSNGSDNNTMENGIGRSMNDDRSRGSRNNGSKYTGLEMRMDLLTTFHASKLGSNASRLRYIRAKWLNPLVLVLLTRSPYLDDEFLLRQSNGGNALASEMVVAQVWTVAEVIHQNEEQKDSIDKSMSPRPSTISHLMKFDGWGIPSGVGANVALVSELKMPCGDSFDELVHDTFTLSQPNSAPMNGDYGRDYCPDLEEASILAFPECARGMSIFYHRGTDSLAINSQVVTCASASTGVAPLKVRPFCLIWDWKRNVPGLTLASSKSYCLYHQQQDTDADIHTAPSLFSWFHLGEDDDYGLCAVHVYEQALSKKRRRAGKDIFTVSTLSPINRLAAEGSLSLNEPSAILLHRDSVTFPSLGRPSNTGDVSLQWDESRVPPTYVASNGPCRIAAVGKDYGRSIAVAASRGLCVLDLSRIPRLEPQHTGQPGSASVPSSMLSRPPRWKQFSNVNDEQRFRVVSMIWFERGNETIRRTKEDSSEDLLLAVVQYTTVDTLYLVCWSRKRLGFGENQLLKESSSHFAGEEDGSDAVSRLGVALPPGFRVHSMSIIRDPADGLPSSQSTLSNRALLLLASVSCHEGTGSYMKYDAYQLQTIPSPNGKSELVFARNAACGRIPLQLGTSPDFSATESVTGIFIAGGSFLFDLDTETEGPAVHDVIAVIGVVTLFQGLVAVCVNQTGPILYRPSLLENVSIGECRIGYRKSLVVSYWVSGAISSRYGCRVAWNIAKNDGKVYCWSVPCRNAESSHQSTVGLNGDQYSELLPGLEKHSILGEIVRLGYSSLWMNGATTNERETSIGPFCPVSFGCTLYAGQMSRKNTSISDLKSFHVGNCIVAPPQFTPFLFISFLILSSTPSDHGFEWQLVNRSGQDTSNSLDIGLHHELARDHIKSTLCQLKNLGSSASALRIITYKVIEILNKNDSKVVGDTCLGSGNQDNLSEKTMLRLQNWTVGKAILSEIVSVAKEIYDSLGFATFFLSVGRQLEPHQFNLIFPLPSDSSTPNSPPLRTAEDLFSVSCERGSLATALSALPLYSCHKESQQSVTKLIYHCLIKTEENFRSCSSYTALTSGEDEAFLHQLFWFGVKLEDAIEIENSYEKEDKSICTSESNEDEHSFDSSSIVSSSTANDEESSIDQDTDDFVSVSPSVESYTADYTYYSEESPEASSFLSPCRTPNQKPRWPKVVTKLFPSADRPVNNNSLEEDAIHEAASSFILSGFDYLSIKNPPCTPIPAASELEPADDNHSDSDESSDVADTLPVDVLTPTTVAGTVGLFISHAIAFGGAYHKNNTQNYGWKAVSAVAHLLQGDRETMAITSAGSANAQTLTRILTIEDFLAAATTYDHVGHITDEEDSCNTIAILLGHLTSDCRQQMNSQAFGTVFNLILLLLLRYDTCHDVQQCRATLIAVGIVSGHLSGRISELLDFSETQCDVNDIYSLYAAKLDA